MPDRTREYIVNLPGGESTVLLTEDEAKNRGLHPAGERAPAALQPVVDSKSTTPENKAAQPANKAAAPRKKTAAQKRADAAAASFGGHKRDDDA